MGAVSQWGRRAAVALVLAALLTGFGAADAFASRRPLTIQAEIGGGYVWGQVTDNAYVEVVVRDAVGRLLGRGLADTYAGEWMFSNFRGSILPGYRIKATAFTVNGKLGVRRLTVPNLTIVVNRDTDSVSGKAPGSSRVVVEASGAGGDYSVSEEVQVDAGGHYSYDFGTDGSNIRGGDRASVTWANDAGTVAVNRTAVAPYIAVGIGSFQFSGATRRNLHVEATLADGAAKVLAVGHAVGDWYGRYWGFFADANEEDYQLRAGDWLTAPAIGPDVDWQVPPVIDKVNAATDVVSGECFPGGPYELYASDPAGGEAIYSGIADPSGLFSIDLTPSMNVTRNSWVEAQCWTSEGDSVWDTHGTLAYGSNRPAHLGFLTR